jgi:hypothetical protein
MGLREPFKVGVIDVIHSISPRPCPGSPYPYFLSEGQGCARMDR